MVGPHPAVARTRTAVEHALDDLPADALVLVACSGGPDSMALAAAAAHLARSHRGPRLRVGAVVVDHGLQAGSDRVAAQAAATCRDLGLDPVDVVGVDVVGPGGPEGAARRARYAALTDAADRRGAAAVLLGHTRDDQAEGVLLALARGSGSRSLAGMAPRRGRWHRPLLDLPRADTVAACAAQGLAVWHDPTNDATAPGPAPLRSRVRSRVLPVLEAELGGAVTAALARTADGLREDADALDRWADNVAGRILVLRPDNGVTCDPARLADLPVAVRRRVLKTAAHRAGSPPGALSRTHLLALDALVTDWHGQGPVHLPGRVVAQRSCGRLALRAAPVPDDPAGRSGHPVARPGPGRGPDGVGAPAQPPTERRGDQQR